MWVPRNQRAPGGQHYNLGNGVTFNPLTGETTHPPEHHVAMNHRDYHATRNQIQREYLRQAPFQGPQFRRRQREMVIENASRAYDQHMARNRIELATMRHNRLSAPRRNQEYGTIQTTQPAAGASSTTTVTVSNDGGGFLPSHYQDEHHGGRDRDWSPSS